MKIAMGALAFLGLGVAVAQVHPARVVKSEGLGRFQIVNGTPEFAKNIMLIDTQTGDSWIACAGSSEAALVIKASGEKDGTYQVPAGTDSRWCYIPKDYKTGEDYNHLADFLMNSAMEGLKKKNQSQKAP
jgi:hypothetical protein